MSILSIPVTPEHPHFEFFLSLEGRQYLFEFRWNERIGSWYMTLSDADGDPIVASARVVLDFPLTGKCADARRPPGAIIAVDTSGAGLDPGEKDLGGRVTLLYVESTSLPTVTP